MHPILSWLDVRIGPERQRRSLWLVGIPPLELDACADSIAWLGIHAGDGDPHAP
jgi:hypothetical protein